MVSCKSSPRGNMYAYTPDCKGDVYPDSERKEVKGILGIYLEERRKLQEFEYGLLIAMLNETGVKLQDTFH